MFWSSQYAVPHLISIFASVLLLISSHAFPRVARALFALLFAWACATNWSVVLERPSVYLEYGGLSVMALYREFIGGFFASHVLPIVGAIATCQGLIAAGLLMGGRPARIALVGAAVFLLAIAPLGVGSAFPSTVIMATGCFRLRAWSEALEHNLLSNLVNAVHARRMRTS